MEAERAPIVRFDQRPGELEATRPPPGMRIVGARAGEGGWIVQAFVRGDYGELVQLQLTPGEAEVLARDLAQTAAICREGFAALERDRDGRRPA